MPATPRPPTVTLIRTATAPRYACSTAKMRATATRRNATSLLRNRWSKLTARPALQGARDKHVSLMRYALKTVSWSLIASPKSVRVCLTLNRRKWSRITARSKATSATTEMNVISMKSVIQTAREKATAIPISVITRNLIIDQNPLKILKKRKR